MNVYWRMKALILPKSCFLALLPLHALTNQGASITLSTLHLGISCYIFAPQSGVLAGKLKQTHIFWWTLSIHKSWKTLTCFLLQIQSPASVLVISSNLPLRAHFACFLSPAHSNYIPGVWSGTRWLTWELWRHQRWPYCISIVTKSVAFQVLQVNRDAALRKEESKVPWSQLWAESSQKTPWGPSRQGSGPACTERRGA